MRLLFTEIVGWLMVLGGLWMMWLLISFAMQRQIFEAGAISLASVVVFRAGIGFVRFAVAGRIASQLNRQELSERKRQQI